MHSTYLALMLKILAVLELIIKALVIFLTPVRATGRFAREPAYLRGPILNASFMVPGEYENAGGNQPAGITWRLRCS